MLTISIMRLKHSAVERKFESSKTNTNEDAIMPLVRIDISKTASKERIRAVSDAVYGAMVEIANVPLHDKFQIITRHAGDEIIYPEEGYLGIEYSRDLIIIQITWVGGRAIDVKKKFYKRIGPVWFDRSGFAVTPEALARLWKPLRPTKSRKSSTRFLSSAKATCSLR
jgi:hypothetical protein